jgi:hypothetical protein
VEEHDDVANERAARSVTAADRQHAADVPVNEQRMTAMPVQAQGWSYTCYNCGEEGHFQHNCPHSRKQRSGWTRQENGQGREGNGTLTARANSRVDEVSASSRGGRDARHEIFATTLWKSNEN